MKRTWSEHPVPRATLTLEPSIKGKTLNRSPNIPANFGRISRGASLRRILLLVLLGSWTLPSLTCMDPKHPLPPGTVAGEVEVRLPAGCPAKYEDIVVYSGALHETGIDGTGKATVGLLPNAVNTVFAVTNNDRPILYAVLTPGGAGERIVLDARSTAEALVFLHPYIGQCDLTIANGLLGLLSGLREVGELTNLISARLTANTNYLRQEDTALTRTILRAVKVAHSRLDSIEDVVADASAGTDLQVHNGHKYGPMAVRQGSASSVSPAGGVSPEKRVVVELDLEELTITPAEMSGVYVRAVRTGAGRYRLWVKNTRRRDICAYLMQAGSYDELSHVDVNSCAWIKYWPPSVGAPDSGYVNLDASIYRWTWIRAYGFGFHFLDEWDSDPKKVRVASPAIYTFVYNFAIPCVSAFTGLPGIFGRGTQVGATLANQVKDAATVSSVCAYLARKQVVNALGAVGFRVLGVLKSNPQLLVDAAAELGITITRGSAEKVLSFVPYLGFLKSCVDAANVGWTIGTVARSGAVVDFIIRYEGGTTNRPPNTPSTPSGPPSGQVGVPYTFSSTATDPDGDDVFIRFAWGDGDTSGWIPLAGAVAGVPVSRGPAAVKVQPPSGTAVGLLKMGQNLPGAGRFISKILNAADSRITHDPQHKSALSLADSARASHVWSSPGTYQIKAQAKDEHEAQSSWTVNHSITIDPYSPGPPGWLRTYVQGIGNAVKQTQDGGFIVAGQASSSAIILRTSSDGGFIWSKTYEGGRWGLANDVCQLHDGGFAVAGIIEEGGIYYWWVLRTNSSGDSIWTRRHETRLGGATSVILNTDGSFVVVGSRDDGADAVCLRPDGSEVWRRTYDDAYEVLSVCRASDGGLAFAGQAVGRADGAPFCLGKTNSSGVLNWHGMYGATDTKLAYYGRSVCQRHGGGFVVLGDLLHFETPVYRHICAVGVDAQGDSLWWGTYGPSTYNVVRGTGIAQTPTGYIICGTVNSNGAPDEEPYLAGVDLNGGCTWEKRYSKPWIHEFLDIRPTSDGGFVCTGRGYASGHDEIVLLKVNQYGDTTGGGGGTNNPPITPGAPEGPASGQAGVSYEFTGVTTDPDGDRIQYRFDWGNGTQSNWSSLVPSGTQVRMSYAWPEGGTYGVKVQAKDELGAMSSWSAAHQIVISGGSNNPPLTPSTPTGPDSGYVDSTYSFRSNAIDPDGDSVFIRFAWGDGDTSAWSSRTRSGGMVTMDHSWSSAGTYQVKAQAKDTKNAVSGWSSALSVRVDSFASNRPPDTPTTPTGPDSGYVDSTYSFGSSAIDPDGDSVSLRFAWGDGDTSAWSSHARSGQPVAISHSWSSAGTFQVKAQARDANGAASGWSPSHQVAISEHSPYPNKVVAMVSVGSNPDGLAALPSGAYVYVANFMEGSVSVIRTSDNSVVANVTVGSGPTRLAALPNGAFVYVTNVWDGRVSVIRTSDRTVAATVQVEHGPRGLAALPDGSHVYVANTSSNSVSVIRTSDNTVTARVSVTGPGSVAALPSGSYVYVTRGGTDNVDVIRTSGNQVVATVAVGDVPSEVVALPNGAYVYVSNFHSHDVSVIRTSDNTVVGTVAVGPNPRGIGVLPGGNYVYVACNETVYVIRTADNSVVATVAVQGREDVATLPNGDYVYVTNWGDGSVSVIGR